MNRFIFRPSGIAFLTGFLVLLDQFTKILAVRFLKGQEAFVIWKDVFVLQYLENRGAAFGMFQEKQMIFILFGFCVLIGAFYLFFHMSKDNKFWPIRICAILVLSGALGNLIDRLYRSFVVDFFYFKLINFPIFNVADIYVSVGTAVAGLMILFYYSDDDLEHFLEHKEERQL